MQNTRQWPRKSWCFISNPFRTMWWSFSPDNCGFYLLSAMRRLCFHFILPVFHIASPLQHRHNHDQDMILPDFGKSQRSVPREQNCPVRNEFAVKAAGMLCVRRCSVDKDCTNDRKLCLCDGLCGLSCIRPEKECPELPDPEHGQVTLGGRHFQVKKCIYVSCAWV